jgi:O-antigen ligase
LSGSLKFESISVRLNRKRVSGWIEIAIALLYVAILGIAPLAFGGVRAQEFAYIQWLTVAVAAFWIFQVWTAPRFRLLFPPTCWAVIPAVAYAVWRYRTADVEYAARIEFVQLLVVALLFFAFVANLYSQQKILWITVMLIVVATFAAMYGVYQWLTGSDHVWFALRGAYHGRGSGPFVSPNHLAGFLEMTLPLVIALLVVSRFGALSRVLLTYAATVILIGIAATGSRAGWISTAVAVLLLGLALLKTRKQWLSATIVILVVGCIGAGLYGRVIAPRFSAEQMPGKFDDIRFSIWKSAWRMWSDNSLTGVGPNHFDIRYPSYRENHWATKWKPGYVHNDYLNTLVDWGSIGLGLFVFPFFVAGWGIKYSWRSLHRGGNDLKQSGGNRMGLVLGSALGLVAILVHSFFDFNFHIPANAIAAATILAVLTTHWRFATERYWLPMNWFTKSLVTLLLGVGMWYLSINARIKSEESAALRRAELANPASTNEIAALKDALRVEPGNYETAFRIGDRLRVLSFTGRDNSERLAMEAIEWFRRAISLNRWHSRSYAGLGMCLDWLNQHQEADACFKRAVELDPNHFEIRALMGWHLFQTENYAESINWFNRSLELNSNPDNTIAYSYRDFATKEILKSQRSIEH